MDLLFIGFFSPIHDDDAKSESSTSAEFLRNHESFLIAAIGAISLNYHIPRLSIAAMLNPPEIRKMKTKIFLLALASLSFLQDVEAQSCPPRPVELVDSWYRRYVHRPIDDGGIQVYVGQLRNGVDPYDVEGAILGSAEYFVNHGSCPRRFISGLYEDVLGRSCQKWELDGWYAELQKCGCRTKLACKFIRAAQGELRNRPLLTRRSSFQFEYTQRYSPVPSYRYDLPRTPVVVPSFPYEQPRYPVDTHESPYDLHPHR